jgi:hypothetical protein
VLAKESCGGIERLLLPLVDSEAAGEGAAEMPGMAGITGLELWLGLDKLSIIVCPSIRRNSPDIRKGCARSKKEESLKFQDMYPL